MKLLRTSDKEALGKACHSIQQDFVLWYLLKEFQFTFELSKDTT